MLSDHERTDIYTKAVEVIAGSLGRPRLFGPTGKPLAPSSSYTYQRTAASNSGSMKGWRPRLVGSKQAVSMQRQAIAARSVDLVQNDPHAAGVVDGFATTVIGSGLIPQPNVMTDLLGIEKKTARTIQKKQRQIYDVWQATADAGGRMTFGNMQYVIERSNLEYGEHLVIVHMIDDVTRPYMLACRVLNPLRMKTPSDLINNPKIIDGVEVGEHSEPIAYWIKKSEVRGARLPDTSGSFLRIPAKEGHRWKALHGFFNVEPEKVRGMPVFAPAMKWFKDLNDYLDAELISNIVTSAFALFIEAQEGSDPWDTANLLKTRTDTITDGDGNSEDVRYEEIQPGTIMYGSSGQKPHPIAANRPGVTFDPFTKIIKKAIAVSMGVPYAVLFKDHEGVSFAGMRSSMLDAWRVYMMHRTNVGETFCQKPYVMLQEEAWLRGELPEIDDFYSQTYALTRCTWRGSPKGDIEPVKAVKADLTANAGKVKTLERIITENGDDYESTMDQLEDEQEDLADRGLTGSAADPAANANTGPAAAVNIDEIAEAVADELESRANV